MPGKTKRKYVCEQIRFKKSLKRPLNLIQEVLPKEYKDMDILNLFQKLYPFEWNQMEQMYKVYKEKDDFLEFVHKKKRYYHKPPVQYFLNLAKVKNMLSDGVKQKHKLNFDEVKHVECLSRLERERRSKVEIRNNILRQNKDELQFVEPLYIDILIHEYHKKGATNEYKIEILKEIQKYDCEKSIQFISKINDSEHNKQLRTLAFKHLQTIGKYVRKRSSFKGKTKSYMTEYDDFIMEAKDLYDRISNDSIQNRKTFDYFISHSYKDKDLIKNIRRAFNESKFHVYCDWTSDNDFLKRDPNAKHYTELILKKRIEQSKNIVFVRTNNTNDTTTNSIMSEWIQLELDYSRCLGKKIYCINLSKDNSHEFVPINYDVMNNTINF